MGTSYSFDTERKALHAVLDSAAFQSSSNSARLLSFLCEQHFEGPDRELT
jgi:hypothetical protein